jgi:hypothetical protein
MIATSQSSAVAGTIRQVRVLLRDFALTEGRPTAQDKKYRPDIGVYL